MTTTLTRADIQSITSNPKAVRALEDLFRAVSDGTLAQQLNVAATTALQDATVVTLSPNETLTNERVISQGRGISLTDTGSTLTVALAYALFINGGYRLSINLQADTDLTAVYSGSLMVSETPVANLGDYANDAAAAAGGVEVAGLYQTSGTVKVRNT